MLYTYHLDTAKLFVHSERYHWNSLSLLGSWTENIVLLLGFVNEQDDVMP